MDEATSGPQGRRRVVLLLYLLLSPIGIAASLALGARGGYGPVIAKALVLLAAIVWLLVRRTLTRVEWVVLIALVPAFIRPRRPGWRGRTPTTRSSSRWSR